MPDDKAERSGQVLSGKEIAKEFDIPLFLTSAKTGKGVEDAFNYAVERCAIAEQSAPRPYQEPVKRIKSCSPMCLLS